MLRLILARDLVRLRTPQVLVDPLPLVPAGAIGRVIKIGPAFVALVDFRPKYGPIDVKLDDLERATVFDLLPLGVRRVGRAFGNWLIGGPAIAGAALIGALAGRAVSHLLGC
jgi:hypothetical protein